MKQPDLFDGDALPVAAELSEIPEADVQEKCVDYARSQGAWARKFSSPANRSVPDYIFCWTGLLWLVEFKRYGKRPTQAQYDEHKKIREAGGHVWVVDNVAEFKRRAGLVFFNGKKALYEIPFDLPEYDEK